MSSATSGPGWPSIEKPIHMPSAEGVAQAMLELAAGGPSVHHQGEVVGFGCDADGLTIHTPFGDVPQASAAFGIALRTQGWPESIEAVRVALRSFPTAAAKLHAKAHASKVDLAARNALLVALEDDDTRAAWLASMRARPEVADAIALGELHATSDQALARWALCTTPEHLRAALASKPR